MDLALNYQRVDPSRGGAETYVVDLCRALVRRGHRVVLYAASWAEGCLPREVEAVRVEPRGWSRLDRIWSFAERSEQAIARGGHEASVGFINTWGHDILIPQGGVQQGSLRANSARYVSPIGSRAYLLSKQANPKYWLYRAIERKQFDPARGARYIAVSRMVRGHIEEFHGVPGDRIHVVPNSIDVGRLEVVDPLSMKKQVRLKLGLQMDDLVGLFVGHNFSLKGLDPLIRAMGSRRRRDDPSRPMALLVCGGGKISPYARMVHRLGLENDIRLLGFYPDVREVYRAADFFVQPTFYDPCSLVVMEALACGLPVITTAQNGAGELMKSGREGFVLRSPRAEDELIAALDAMTDDDRRRAMSEEARSLGREQTFDRHVERLLAVLEEVASTKRGTKRVPSRGIRPARAVVS